MEIWQIIHHLVEPLNGIWVGQLCSDIVKHRQNLDNKQRIYDSARIKHLGFKKCTKKDILKKSEDELKKLKSEAENARYNISRKLSEVIY